MSSTDDFLRGFDRRRDAAAAGRKRTDPPPEGEAADEAKGLLDFADLLRERCAPEGLAAGEAREKVKEKLKEKLKTKLKTKLKRELGELAAARGRRRARRVLFLKRAIPAAAGLFLAVTLGWALFGGGVDPADEGPASRSGPGLVGTAEWKPLERAAKDDEFAGIDFPEVIAKVVAEAPEREDEGDVARPVRRRGLVVFRRKGSKLWRFVTRGTTFSPGDTVRTSRRLDSGAILRGPEGSRVSLAPGTVVGFEARRRWRLDAGEAHFLAASGRGLGDFVVDGPGGKAVAKGTEFRLRAGDGRLSCLVVDGTVEMQAGAGTPLRLTAGRAGSVDPEGVRELKQAWEKGEWLDGLKAEDETKHGLGELLARAVDDKHADLQPLEVKSHNVTVTVVHPVARTFIDEVFVNNTGRRLEGTFYYPLPPDAAVSEFAMYVNGERIIGEVLERHRARQVFEYIRRQRRDPALLEWVGGNLFKMRVFPIEPHSEKRIQLGYTQVLRRDRGKVTYTYPLVSEKLLKNPLREVGVEFRLASRIGFSNLWCESHRAEPVVTEDGRAALAFGARDYTPERDFTVSYRVDDAAEVLSFANRRPGGPEGGEDGKENEKDPYFLLELAPKVELPYHGQPKRLLIIVDASPSVGPRGFALATEFASAAADFSLGWELDVIAAGVEAERWRETFVPVDAGTPDEVREFLEGRTLLGATDLQEAFREAAELVSDGEPVELVYIGDGLDTLGELEGSSLVREIASLFRGPGRKTDVRGSCVAVGESYDEPLMRELAAALGGGYVRVAEAGDVFVAADAIMERVSRPVLNDVRVSFEGFETRDCLPGRLSALPAGSSTVVVGRIKQGGAGSVTVTGRADDEEFARTYDLTLSPDEEHNRFIPRLWAKSMIDDLESGLGLTGAEGDAEIARDVIDLSVRYQIMSRFTAFLVLESEDDYRKYGIKRRTKMIDWTGGEEGIEFGQAGHGMDMNAPITMSEAHMSLGGSSFSTGVRRAASARPVMKVAELPPASGPMAFDSLILHGSEGLGIEFADPFGDDNGWFDGADRDAVFDISLGGTGLVSSSVSGSPEWSAVGGKLSYSGWRYNNRTGDALGFRSGGGRRRAALRGGGVRAGEVRYKSSNRAYSGYYHNYYPQGPLFHRSGDVAGLALDRPRRAPWEYERLLLAGGAGEDAKRALELRLNLALACEAVGRSARAAKALRASPVRSRTSPRSRWSWPSRPGGAATRPSCARRSMRRSRQLPRKRRPGTPTRSRRRGNRSAATSRSSGGKLRLHRCSSASQRRRTTPPAPRGSATAPRATA
ncbi:MAG: VIT domain-containing protein [Planctomycetota bacterium]|jgi:ferric-dicitrate binding protein FerR (iron transport regulator)